MKYMTQKNTLIALAVVVIVVSALWSVGLNSSPKSETLEQIATTTLQVNGALGDADKTSVVLDINPVKVQKPPISEEGTESNLVGLELVTQKTIDLGPRKKAGSPAAALQYFAEAMKAGDRERAISYFGADQQEQYRRVFKNEFTGLQHPVVTAYFNGKVDDAELIQPRYGLYEIRVYPTKDSESSFSVNTLYDSTAGEFVLTEL